MTYYLYCLRRNHRYVHQKEPAPAIPSQESKRERFRCSPHAPGLTPLHACVINDGHSSGIGGAGKTETVIVVTVVRSVPVAVGRAQVRRIVVPTAATKNPFFQGMQALTGDP